MRRKKWKTVMIWGFSIVIVVCIGGAFAANYAVDKILNSMVEDIDFSADSDMTNNIDGISLEVGNTSVSDKSEKQDGSDSADMVKQQESNVPNNQGDKKDTITGEEKNKDVIENEKENVNQDAVGSYTPNVSIGKMENIKESVTIKDKAYVTSILLQSLEISSIKRLQELAKGGLTVEEKKEARSIIMEKVTPEQYNKLSDIGRKYGVSEGRNFDQIKKSQGDD